MGVNCNKSALFYNKTGQPYKSHCPMEINLNQLVKKGKNNRIFLILIKVNPMLKNGQMGPNRREMSMFRHFLFGDHALLVFKSLEEVVHTIVNQTNKYVIIEALFDIFDKNFQEFLGPLQ